MPRKRVGSLDQHHGGFRVRWTSKGRRNNRTFASEQEAREFLERLRANEVGRPRQRLSVGLTVMDVVQNWYQGHRRNLSPGTQRDYEGRIHRDVGRIASIDANELARNPRDLRSFYATLTPTNARRLHAILRQAFEDAVAHGEVERNPCILVKPRKPSAPEKLIPSPSEVEKIVIAAEEEDHLWGLFLNITATLGTRRGETCALRWEDFDFDDRRVHVRRALCKGLNGPTEIKLPKNGRERSLLVGDRFFQQLLAFRHEAGWVFSAGARAKRDHPWHPDWPGHRFQRLAERLQLPYTLHSLRHFVATQLLARGLPVTQVAKFLGHKDPSVTMNLYGNHLVDDIQRAMGVAAASLFRRTTSEPTGS
jgi:integrase